MNATLETLDRGLAPTRPQQGWFERHRASIVRHGTINFFMLIILAPLAWVIMMSIKSRPDAMRGDFWPRRFEEWRAARKAGATQPAAAE